MKFRKIPVVVDAILWNGRNYQEVCDFVQKHIRVDCMLSLYIWTLEGEMEARMGDWIIRGVEGEYYPCKPQIFEKTYERVEENV